MMVDAVFAARNANTMSHHGAMRNWKVPRKRETHNQVRPQVSHGLKMLTAYGKKNAGKTIFASNGVTI